MGIAIIKNNKVFCPICENSNAHIEDYFQVYDTSHGSATKYECQCNICHAKFEYLGKIVGNNNLRFTH